MFTDSFNVVIKIQYKKDKQTFEYCAQFSFNVRKFRPTVK